MLVPDRRSTGWVKSLTNVNAKYLFGFLILGLDRRHGPARQPQLRSHEGRGAWPLIGLFAGIFIFMGFIWAVIGE